MVMPDSRPTPPSKAERAAVPSHSGNDLGPVLTRILCAPDEIRDRLAGSHKDWYTVEEVAHLTGRSAYTIRRWIKATRLEAVRVQDTGPRGRLLIARDQLHRLTAAGLGCRVPDACLGQAP